MGMKKPKKHKKGGTPRRYQKNYDKIRTCLWCKLEFCSTGPGNRRCRNCEREFDNTIANRYTVPEIRTDLTRQVKRKRSEI